MRWPLSAVRRLSAPVQSSKAPLQGGTEINGNHGTPFAVARRAATPATHTVEHEQHMDARGGTAGRGQTEVTR